jgi:hypothetical protein
MMKTKLKCLIKYLIRNDNYIYTWYENVISCWLSRNLIDDLFCTWELSLLKNFLIAIASCQIYVLNFYCRVWNTLYLIQYLQTFLDRNNNFRLKYVRIYCCIIFFVRESLPNMTHNFFPLIYISFISLLIKDVI